MDLSDTDDISDDTFNVTIYGQMVMKQKMEMMNMGLIALHLQDMYQLWKRLAQNVLLNWRNALCSQIALCH